MNNTFIRPTVIFLLIALIVTNAYPQSGTLDNSFDYDGMAITNMSLINSNDMCNASAIQTDDKIVVVGYANNGSNVDVTVARYLTNGSLDSAFGTNGRTLTDISASQDYASATCLQPDGKIIIAGYTINGGMGDFLIARYNVDGNIDSTFGLNGLVIEDMGGSDERAYAVCIQPDGKIIVAGYTNLAILVGDFAVLRLNQNGTIDSTFDVDGKTTTPIGTNDDVARSVVVQSDGKIIVAGYSHMGASPKYDFSAARYNINGSLDVTFDSDGIVNCNLGSSDDQCYAISIQSDNKIILAGYSDNGFDKDFALIRYLPNGTLDYSFDTDGKVITNFGSSNDEIKAMTVQPDNKIIVAGRSVVGVDGDFSLARYLLDGSLDITFDSDGMITTNSGEPYDYANAIGIQSDGKIVVAGSTNNVGGFLDFAVLRYNNTLTIGLPTENQDLITASIYPNPLVNWGYLSISNVAQNQFPFELMIYNMHGEVVHSEIIMSEKELIILTLEAGSYIYRVLNSDKNLGSIIGKVIVY